MLEHTQKPEKLFHWRLKSVFIWLFRIEEPGILSSITWLDVNYEQSLEKGVLWVLTTSDLFVKIWNCFLCFKQITQSFKTQKGFIHSSQFAVIWGLEKKGHCFRNLKLETCNQRKFYSVTLCNLISTQIGHKNWGVGGEWRFLFFNSKWECNYCSRIFTLNLSNHLPLTNPYTLITLSWGLRENMVQI